MVHPSHLNAMKPFILLLVLAGLPIGAIAKPLEKKNGLAYSHLWKNSPFTTPRQKVAVPTPDPFGHYALAGVAPIPGGYRINLLDRRDPGTSIVLSDRPEFKLLTVHYSSGNPLDTTVRLSLEGKEGIVTFDPKLLKDRPNPANVTQPPVPRQPAQVLGHQPRTLTIGQSAGDAIRPH